MARVLIVHKDAGLSGVLKDQLARRGIKAATADSLTSTFNCIDDNHIEIVIFELCMACKGGLKCGTSLKDFVMKHFLHNKRPRWWLGINAHLAESRLSELVDNEIDVFSWPVSLEVLSEYCSERLFGTQISDFYLDPVNFVSISNSGQKTSLTAIEFQILSLFKESVKKRIHRDDFVKRVWREQKLGPKTLNVHLSHLRSKLKEQGLGIQYKGNSEFELCKVL